MASKMYGMDHLGSVRLTPWHGIGTILKELANRYEMLEASRMGYTIVKEPATRINAAGKLVTIPDEFWTVRQDTDYALGRVGKDYVILQNEDMFTLADAITMDPNGPKFEVAGTLRNGRTSYVLLRIPGFIQVTPRDTIYEFVLIVNSHDGSKAVTVLYTSVRVVCQNTMNMALKSGEDLFKMRHGNGMMTIDTVQKIRSFLGIVSQASDGFIEKVTALQSFKPTTAQVDDVLSKLFVSAKGEDSTRVKNIKTEVKNLIHDGEANRMAGSTDDGWAFLNAITEYAGYGRTVRTSLPEGISESAEIQLRAEARFDSAFFGDANRLKDKAFAAVLALAK